MVCPLNNNQVGRTRGNNVKAKYIIDIIDGYKGGGYGVLTQHKLGWYTLALLQDWVGGEIAFQEADIIGA